jgi:hypothetical protein
MSKGPGHVMRRISEAIAAEPRRAFDVEELCRRVYPDADRFELKHRQAVIRAMRKLVLTRADLGLSADGRVTADGHYGAGRGRLILYRLDEPGAYEDYERRTWSAWYERHKSRA